jgi:hypothetical protein
VSGVLAPVLIAVLLAVGGWLFYLYDQREKERAVMMATTTDIAPEPPSPLQARMWIWRWIPAILGIVLCLTKLLIRPAWTGSIVLPFAALLVITSGILYYLDYRRQRQQPPERQEVRPIPPHTVPPTTAPDERPASSPKQRPWWRSGLREGATGLAALPWWWAPAVLAVGLCAVNTVQMVKSENGVAWVTWWVILPITALFLAVSIGLGYWQWKKQRLRRLNSV